MKKIVKKMKGKKVLSIVLSAIMLLAAFNVALPQLKLDVSAADITLSDGDVSITQTHVVSDYATLYAGYADRFFGGEGKSEATNFVIPGLSSSDDYTPQGMTYWKEKDWILISAYDASGSGKHSVVYALDGATTEFVALFKILNADGSVNTSHGGGIAASEYNFYYADVDSKISYVPLSEMDVADGTVKEIQLQGSIDCSREMNTAKTSYCCYDEGVLWTGNFYFSSEDSYKQPANANYNSMLFGYKLQGNSSEEEWMHLQDKNLLTATATGDLSVEKSPYGTLSYNVSVDKGRYIDITGNITHDETQGTCSEYAPSFATVTLEHGVTYKFEFDLTTPTMDGITDFYFLRDGGTGSYTNIRYTVGGSTKVTDNGDGTYHYETTLTPGESLINASGSRAMDGNWDNVDDASGTYSLRFDQDSITTDRTVSITNIHLYEAPDGVDLSTENGKGCEGNPTYCIAFSDNLDRVQYAMVDNGRIYISRSWSRTESTNHVRQLVVGEIDLNSYGTVALDINGVQRQCQYVDDTKMTLFGGGKDDDTRTQMLYMGEALCVMEGYLYMFGESAAWNYYGKSDSVCPEPIDVIWKIDQYAIMGELRKTDNERSLYYEQVTSTSQIKNTSNDLLNTDEYLILYESSEVDPVTQKNVLYALDSFGGHDVNKLPKNNVSNGALSDNSNGYTIGIVGHPITEYAIEDGKLYLNNSEEDDVENVRWKFSGEEGNSYFCFQSVAPYYARYNELYFNGLQSFMSEDASNVRFGLDFSAGNGKCYITVAGTYYMWCNDGAQGYDSAINSYYKAQGYEFTEQAGTFHADGLNILGNNVISGSVKDFAHGQFYIFKRVLDPYVEKEYSRIFTDSTVELQADGTYTIDMETYAISPTHYTLLDEQRPTDFIFVLDTSGSMSTQDCNGYHRHNSFDLEAAAGTQDVAGHTNNSENSSTVGTYTGNMWVQHSDGVMCQVSVKAQGDGRSGSFISYTYYQRIYLWYTHPTTGTVYWYHPNTGTWTTTETTYDEAQRVGASSKSGRYGTNVFSGVCYEKRSNSSRLSNLQLAVNQLTYKIQNEATTTGLNHRIAIVQYGSNSDGSWTNMGMYPNTGTSMVSYTGEGTVSATNYQNAFFETSQFDSVRTIINNLSASGDTFVDYGFDMAQNIINHAKGVGDCTGYLADGNRSACIIMITDGCPGFGGDDSTTANTVAEAAIDNAKLAKDAGAYIFTVQMGDNSMSGFDMDAYMDYVSSEFVDATGMSTPGERNTSDVDYRMDVDAGSSFSLDTFVDSMFNNVIANSRMALTQLDSDSYLRQTISDEFYAPVGEAQVQYLFADGYYDGLGRLTFGEETDASGSGITGTPGTAKDSEGNEYYDNLVVTGFNYKTNYISKLHGGKKLIVRITGILPRETSLDDGSEFSHVNSPVSNEEDTGIYQTEKTLAASEEFKGFPVTTFSIPEYTYVLDYGLPMLDTEVNGTLCSVSAGLTKQTTYKTVSENGLVAIQSGNQNLIYSATPTEGGESGYVLIQRDSGEYDWFEIKVVPASNVLYEETWFTAKASDNVDWTVAGGTPKATYQSLTNADTDVYGNDDVYAVGENAYSNNTAIKTTVNSTDKRSDSTTFTFKGTGFDLISACGANTGMQIVTVRKADNSIAKVMIVDTYYNDTTYVDANGLLNQVPIASFTGEHGEYTVEVTATYLSYAGALSGKSASRVVKGASVDATAATPVGDAEIAAMLKSVGMGELAKEDVEVIWFDDNSIFNGGTGAEGIKSTRSTRAGTGVGVTELVNYIDGIRIYHPMDAEYGDYIAGEQGAQYINVIDNLANESLGDGGTAFGLAYVEGSLAEGEALSFANYQKIGPENEFYLAAGNSDTTTGLAFNIDAPAGSTVMLGLRAIGGATTVKVNGTEFPVNSATEMYYNITGILNGATTITIANTGSSPLAVNNIKLAGNAAVGALSLDDMGTIDELMTMETVEAEVVNGTVTVPVPEEEPEIPEDETGNDGESSTLFNILDMIMAIIGEFLKTIMSFMG